MWRETQVSHLEIPLLPLHSTRQSVVTHITDIKDPNERSYKHFCQVPPFWRFCLLCVFQFVHQGPWQPGSSLVTRCICGSSVIRGEYEVIAPEHQHWIITSPAKWYQDTDLMFSCASLNCILFFPIKGLFRFLSACLLMAVSLAARAITPVDKAENQAATRATPAARAATLCLRYLQPRQ